MDVTLVKKFLGLKEAIREAYENRSFIEQRKAARKAKETSFNKIEARK